MTEGGVEWVLYYYCSTTHQGGFATTTPAIENTDRGRERPANKTGWKLAPTIMIGLAWSYSVSSTRLPKPSFFLLCLPTPNLKVQALRSRPSLRSLIFLVFVRFAFPYILRVLIL